MRKPEVGFVQSQRIIIVVKSTLAKTIFKKHVAIPADHGSWVFMLSPLLIGLFAGGRISAPSLYLIIASMAGFLIRQPVTIAVKVLSGRRSKKDFQAAMFWIGIYGVIASVSILELFLLGYGYVIILAIPGVFVFLWHLNLVRTRSERHQMGVEIVASGVLALSAPAMYWVGIGHANPQGWILVILVWLQSATSIVYAYLRLGQRDLKTVPKVIDRLKMGWRALLYSGFDFALVLFLSILGFLPPLLFIPYSLQFIETLYGTLSPAIGVKPTRIGFRQLIISSLFTLLFILTWS
ncbi:MAG: YwiC-like family protein [Anaerolineales bacterium]|nr:YwiC-like family protein [Anaerolineales bacterium]